jgi:hypothetical protein
MAIGYAEVIASLEPLRRRNSDTSLAKPVAKETQPFLQPAISADWQLAVARLWRSITHSQSA